VHSYPWRDLSKARSSGELPHAWLSDVFARRTLGSWTGWMS